MPLSDEQRDMVCKEADSWFGTPYRGWSCLKGAGTDCGQYLYGVFHGLGFIPEVTLPKDYSLQVSQHQVSYEYVQFIERFCREIPMMEAKPADIVVYKMGLAFAHAAIIIKWPDRVIHCFARGVKHAHGTNMPGFRHTEKKFFTLKEEFCGVPIRVTTGT
jgi:hypothetical protein